MIVRSITVLVAIGCCKDSGMARILFQEDGCRVVDDLDRVLFTGGYAECERYLDLQENLQTIARRAADKGTSSIRAPRFELARAARIVAGPFRALFRRAAG